MAQTAIQLYTLREIDKSLPDVLDLVGETSLDGVEFAHKVRDADVDAVIRALDRNDLDVSAAHVGLEMLEEDYQETVGLYSELDCDTLIVPWLDPEHFASEEAVPEVASRLESVASDLDEDGFELQYHNHDHEFIPLGEGTALDELYARTTDLKFEIDLGWAQAGGVDPVAAIDRYGARTSHVHFADTAVDEAKCVELGEGALDLDACIDAVRDSDIEWYVYEHDEPTDPRNSLRHGAETLELI